MSNIPILEVVKPPEQGQKYLPDVHCLYHGIFYARWSAISALTDALLAWVGNLWLEPQQHISTWPPLDQLLLGLGIFAFFLFGSICAFLLGYRFFEAHLDLHVRRKRSQALNLENLRWPLGFCGIAVALMGVYDWLQHDVHPIAFSLASIFLFLVVWTLAGNVVRRHEEQAFNASYVPVLSTRHLLLRLLRVKISLNARTTGLQTTVVGRQTPGEVTS